MLFKAINKYSGNVVGVYYIDNGGRYGVTRILTYYEETDNDLMVSKGVWKWDDISNYEPMDF